MNKLTLYCKLSGLIFSWLWIFTLFCEAQTITQRAGELIYGINPYPDMDFFSTNPNSKIIDNSFYYNLWHGFSLNQQLVYNRILLSSLPPSPALSYKNAPYNTLCENGDMDLCTKACAEGGSRCYLQNSQDMWVNAIKAYSNSSIEFDEKGYIILTNSSLSNSPAYPPALSLIKDETPIYDNNIRNVSGNDYKNLFNVNNHIKAVYKRLNEIKENVNHWSNWYSWCSHPPSLDFNQYESLSAGDADAINLMSLLEPTSTPSTIDSNKVQIALQNNCLTDSLNYITTQLRYENDRQGDGDVTKHFPFNINYNLPGIVNLGSIEESKSGKDIQILPSRGWFDAIGMFNYYLNRCSMEKLVLEDVLNCLELIEIKDDGWKGGSSPILTNEEWIEMGSGKISMAPAIFKCQTKYSDWFYSKGVVDGGSGRKSFVYLGLDSEQRANNSTNSFYNYKILQNLSNTTISHLGNTGVYVDVCINPMATNEIDETFQGQVGAVSQDNKISGREWVTPCKGGTCSINIDSDNPFDIFRYILQ